MVSCSKQRELAMCSTSNSLHTSPKTDGKVRDVTSHQRGLRNFHTSSSVGLLEDIQACPDHVSLLMMVGQNRAKLNEDHVSQAMVQLWEVMKFTANRKTVLENEVQTHRDFLTLCVLVENKVHLMQDEVLADVLYASLKLLAPDTKHSLIRELRNRTLSRLDKMSCKQLSKVAVCLSDLSEWRAPSFGAVTHAFSQKLDSVENVRELSAWMRECLPLASKNLCSRTYAKTAQFVNELDKNDFGSNDLRRIVQTMGKVPGAPRGLLLKCEEIFLEKMEAGMLSVRDICTMYNLFSNLDNSGEGSRAQVRKYLKQRLPELTDGLEASLAIEILAVRASADTKFMLEDKAIEIVNEVPLSWLHHLCHGLRMMNYVAMKPLTKQIVRKVMTCDMQNLSSEGIARILEFLSKVDGVDERLYQNIYADLLRMLEDSIVPNRIIHIIYCISLLPLNSVHGLVFKKASAILPQLHTPGINQLLSSIVRISHKLQREGTVPNSCSSLLQQLQELAITSINQVTSVYYLNNIVDFLLEEGDQAFLVRVAMQRYSHVLSKLTPQLAVDCAKNITRSKYLQVDLLDEMANILAQNINKITPLQVACVLSPYSLLNYQPPNASQLYEACIGRIEQFLDSLPAGYVVDVANMCALSQRFPEQILKKIFSLEFLTRLDEELEAIPDRSTMYRRKLMNLNRSLAVECPELQVPWFHEDFCQDILKTRKVYFNTALREVQKTLVEVLGGPQFLRSFVITPYHYDISFECVLDSEGSPLPCADYGSVLNRLGAVAGGVLADLMQWGTQTKHLPEGAQRVAIDYLSSNMYCANSPHALGLVTMKKRQLELMGYKYVQIPYYEWYSENLSEREDRIQYIHELIVNSSPVDQLVTGCQEEPVIAVWGDEERAELALYGPRRQPDPDLLDDPLVMKVLHTFDRIGGRTT
ncbi:FAST kinase domain-containing protein 1, mitochondrial-like [Diadema antillarum]|uniref:FAST kinase domain-containing protein 1, mitochondrial-like n=1 Tax=Diadema antillarum TaxID=105358 RepID=UPI003A892FF7